MIGKAKVAVFQGGDRVKRCRSFSWGASITEIQGLPAGVAGIHCEEDAVPACCDGKEETFKLVGQSECGRLHARQEDPGDGGERRGIEARAVYRESEILNFSGNHEPIRDSLVNRVDHDDLVSTAVSYVDIVAKRICQ